MTTTEPIPPTVDAIRAKITEYQQHHQSLTGQAQQLEQQLAQIRTELDMTAGAIIVLQQLVPAPPAAEVTGTPTGPQDHRPPQRRGRQR